MLESYFILSGTGEVLIEKHWRGLTPRTVCDYFWEQVSSYRQKDEAPPIMSHGRYYLLSIHRNNMFMLATTTVETAPLPTLEFLHRVFDTFEIYFTSVDETNIKNNFATVYQLLEEMVDFGYPLTTEPNALRVLIKPPSIISRLAKVVSGGSEGGMISDVLPDGTASNMPWRQTNISYNTNEIYLDLVEEVDSLLTVDGLIISSDVSGVILGNSKLSGIPDLALQFKDPSLIDDCSFHPCVRYNRFDREKIVSFVPPDGPFELMRYRVNKRDGQPCVAPCYASPKLHYDFTNNKGNVTILVGARSTSSLLFPGGNSSSATVENVVVTLPFPKIVRTANLQVSQGTVLYDESTKIAKWTIGTLAAQQTLQLTGTMLLTSMPVSGGGSSTYHNHTGAEEYPPMQLEWTVMLASLSGMGIASLTLARESYKPYKGVRSIAKSGRFFVRTA